MKNNFLISVLLETNHLWFTIDNEYTEFSCYFLKERFSSPYKGIGSFTIDPIWKREALIHQSNLTLTLLLLNGLFFVSSYIFIAGISWIFKRKLLCSIILIFPQYIFFSKTTKHKWEKELMSNFLNDFKLDSVSLRMSTLLQYFQTEIENPLSSLKSTLLLQMIWIGNILII